MVIKSMKLAGFLMQRGFVLLELTKADDKSGRNVFIFNNSEALNNAISVYTKMR